jgi:hypothetical protein
LGDSFIEGFGLKDGERLSDVVERKTGRAGINLGASGSLGPLQYAMIYDAFAPRFAHDAVVVGFLPDNDFTDNDSDFPYWKDQDVDRHRPYYKKSGAGYDLFYKAPARPGLTFADRQKEPPGVARIWWFYPSQYTWTGGFLFAYRGWLQAKDIDIARDVSGNGYFETSRDRLDAAFYFLDEIVKKAAGKQVYIVVIPTYPEIRRLRTEPSPWLPQFKRRFSRQGVTVVDLAPVFAQLPDDQLRSSFLRCDGHWSAAGNQVAANALLAAMSEVSSIRGQGERQ